MRINKFVLGAMLIGVVFTWRQVECSALSASVPTEVGTLNPNSGADLTETPTSYPIPTQTETPHSELGPQIELGKGIIPQITYSGDKKKIFLSDGKSLRVLSAANYTEITSLDVAGSVETISRDGSLAVINELSGYRVYDIRTKKELIRLSPGGSATGVIFTADGRRVIYRDSPYTSGGAYDKICVVDFDYVDTTCYPTQDFEFSVFMTDPAVSPDEKMVAAGYSAGAQKILYIWDLDKMTILHEIKNQPSTIESVAFSLDGSILASAGNDGMVRIWNPDDTREQFRSISAFTDSVENVEFSPNGRQLVVKVANEPEVNYNLESGNITAVETKPFDPLVKKMLNKGYMLSGNGSSVLFSPDRKTLAVGAGSIQIWNVQSHILAAAFIPDSALKISDMAYSPDGNHLAVVTINGDVYSWNILSKELEFSVKFETDVLTGKQIVFSPDASQIALINGPDIEIWSVKTSSKALTLEKTQPMSYPRNISYSDDGAWIYVLLNNNRGLAVWNAKNGKLERQLDLPWIDQYISSETVLDGEWFARSNYNYDDYWIELWNIETGKMVKISTFYQYVRPLGFSMEGKIFAAILNDQMLGIWRTDTCQLVVIFSGDFNGEDVAISPDANLLASANYWKAKLTDIGNFTNAAFQAGFVPAVIPPTPTSAYQSEIYPTATPQPAITVSPLPVPTFQQGAISQQNAFDLQLFGQLGKGRVNNMGWSKDGKTILVGSTRGFYRLDAETLKEVEHFGAGSIWVTSVRELPDGRLLVAGTRDDGKIQVWDAVSRKMIIELKGSGQPVISPNGRWLVYQKPDLGLAIWDLESGQQGNLLRSFYNLSALAFSPDSKVAVAVQSDRSIRAWNVETGVVVNAGGGPEAEITDMNFSPDGKYITGAAGGAAWIWASDPDSRTMKYSLFEGETTAHLTLFKNTVTCAALNRSNSLIAIGTSDRKIWLYSRETGKALGSLEGVIGIPANLSFSPNGKQLLSLDGDGQMIVWDISSRSPLVTAHDFGGIMKGMVSRMDGAVSVWMNNTLWTFDPRIAAVKQTTYIKAQRILAASPAGDVVAGYTPLKVSIYDARNGELKRTLTDEAENIMLDLHYWEGYPRQFYGALFSPDGRHLATFGMGGLWMYTSPEGEGVSHLGGDVIEKAVFSPDGEWFVVSNQLLQPPSLYNSRYVQSLLTIDIRYGNPYRQYSFSPDKRWIVLLRNSWGEAPKLEFVDSSTGNLSRQLELKNLQPISLAYHPSGKLIAVGMEDGRVIFIDPDSTKVVSSLKASPAAVTSLVFSTDGRTLITTGEDGVIRLWGFRKND